MLFAPSIDVISDSALYDIWKPKIDAYNKKLAEGILEPYKIPDSELPSQEELDKGIDAIAFGEKFLTEEEKSLTSMLASELAAQIASGKLTAVKLLSAFAKRATIAHQLTNCAMELFIDEGMARAKELDAYFAETGSVVGPLHGLPVSLKEHYDYKGKVTHLSYVGWLERVSPKTALTLKNLLAQGAVFYIRTSEPQMLMHLDSNNNITGKTRNPWNTSLSPGGSSSGEGAIAAMKGSVFGLGSDIGGSIRCPAAFCGVWGIRPSLKRVSLLNTSSGMVRQLQETVYPVLGPLARSADDIDLFMKSVLAQEPWKYDPDLVPLPWRDVEEPKPSSLKIAVIYDDGLVRPTPPIVRGLKEAVAKLKLAGVEVVEWKNVAVEALIKAAYAGYNADGNFSQRGQIALSGEPLLPLTEKYLTFGCGDKGLSGLEVQKITYVRDEGRCLYLNQMNDENIDFILSPTYVSVAAKPQTSHYWGYTNLWNILDFPNVVFPTGMTVDPELDAVDKSFEARNELEDYEYKLYTGPEDFKNAPVNLQLTGRRYTDETVVKAAKVLLDIISQ